MVVKWKGTVMKVGNSLVLVLPKPLVEGFGIQKGQILEMIARDDGLHISIMENPIVAPIEAGVQKTVKQKVANAEKALTERVTAERKVVK